MFTFRPDGHGSDPIAPGAGTRAYDPAIVADLESAIGRIGLADLLRRLRAEIGLRLLAASTERETLSWNAHALVSSSGTLGFLGLSEACAELGRACRDEIDLAPALDFAGQAARTACAAIDRLLAEFA